MQNRRLRLVGLLSVLTSLGLPAAARAQCTFAGGTGDGTVQGEGLYTVSSGTASPLSHAFGVALGRSYTFDARSVRGGGTLVMNTNTSFCPTTDMVGLRDTTGITPDCIGCGEARRSFISATTGFVEVRVTTTTGPIDYIIKASETTLYSPAWSTNGSFDTFYSFQNTTNSTCNLVLTMVDTAGTVQTTFSAAVASGATLSTNTSALGTARNLAGTARLAHDCPPHAFVAEAAIANFSITPTPYIQIVKFVGVRDGY